MVNIIDLILLRFRTAIRLHNNTPQHYFTIDPINLSDIKVAQLEFVDNDRYPIHWLNNHTWWMIERYNRGEMD